MIAIEPASDLDEVRTIFLEYAHSTGVDLQFQNFDQELATLGTFYAAIFVCRSAAAMPPLSNPSAAERRHGRRTPIAGCVALRDLGGQICEMKRLYIRPAFRGQGLGKRLALHVIGEARRRGFTAMRLDTLPSMHDAMALYESLGFRDIEPYRFNPVAGSRFMELTL